MARRKVAVDLDLDAHTYIDETGKLVVVTSRAKHEIDDLGDKARGTEHDLVKLAAAEDLAKHATDDLGDKARTTAAEMALLDQRIKTARVSVQTLSREFARTGEAQVLKDLNAARRSLSTLERTKSELAAFEATAIMAAAGLVRRFVGSISDTLSQVPEMLSKAKGPILIALVGLVAVFTPVLGAIIAGAVAGSAVGGGIIGGVLSAVKDPRVKAGFQSFARDVGDEFFSGGHAWVDPILRSLDILRDGFVGLNLGDVFAKAAPFLEDLAKGIVALVQNAMPGFIKVMDKSGPIVKIIADGLADVGSSWSDFLTDVITSKGTLEGLDALFGAIAGSIRIVGSALQWLGDVFHDFKAVDDEFSHFWSALLVDTSPQGRHNALGRVGDAAFGAAPKLHDFATTADQAAKAAKHAATETDLYRTALQDLEKPVGDAIADQLSLDQAHLAVAQGFADLAQTIKDNGRHWDDNTQAARNNRTAVYDMIGTLEAERLAAIKHSDGTQAAKDKINAAYDQQIKKLLDLARKAGATRAELDKLSGTYYINIITTMIQRGKSTPEGEVIAHNPNARRSGRAAGGPVLAGRVYSVAEQRSEVFTTRQTWQAPADGWVTPMAAASGGPTGNGGTQRLEMTISYAPGSDAGVMSAITDRLRFDVRTASGGSVQTHLGPRGRAA